MASPWVGAWTWVHDTNDGQLIFSETYNCYAFARKDRPLPLGKEPTEAEAAGLMRSFGGAGAGRFSISPTDDGWIHELEFAYSLRPEQVGTTVRREVRIDGDTMNSNVIRPDGTRADQDIHKRVDFGWNSPTAGVWDLVSSEWDGLMIMTDSQYRYIITSKSRPAVSGRPREMSDADAAMLYRSFDAEGGSYNANERTISRHPVVAKDPGKQGQASSFQRTIDAGTLTLRGDQEQIWHRLE